MTKEEKKAIKYLKNEIERVNKENNFKKIPRDIVCLPLFIGYAETLLNLIEKLQKENEKWKENARIAEENDTTLVLDVNQACKELGISEDTIIADELADKIKEKYILKDKIRELFKELYIIEESKYAKIKTIDSDKAFKFVKDIEKLLEEG